jgi:beta-lactamase class A
MTWPDGHTVVVAAFLTGLRANKKAREALFAEIGKDVADAYSVSHQRL